MTTFDEREQGFEAKFARDEEFQFRVTARRDKLFAHWAAGRISAPSAAAEALAKSVLAIPNGPKHDETVLKHVAEAMTAHGHAPPLSELSAELERCAKEARQQLFTASAGTSEAL